MRLQNSQSRPVPARFDPFLGDTQLRHGYQLLLSASWDELTQLLEGDPESWLLQSILTSDDAAVETVVLERLSDARPSARSLSLLGGAQVRDALALLDHGGPMNGTRSPARDQAETHLLEAESTLQQAVRLRPALADPWVHLLVSGRLLGIDLPELRARFENAHSRVPFRPDACREYLFGLSSRGGGSDAAMFEFARWVTLESDLDSPARVVMPMAHLEFGMGETTRVSMTDHLAMERTVDELGPALSTFLENTSTQAGPADLLTLNAFGLAMTVNNSATAHLVQECFRRIDNRPTSYPWSLYQDEEIPSVFAEVQRTQLRSVARFL